LCEPCEPFGLVIPFSAPSRRSLLMDVSRHLIVPGFDLSFTAARRENHPSAREDLQIFA
jgi:hypothetical protein